MAPEKCQEGGGNSRNPTRETAHLVVASGSLPFGHEEVQSFPISIGLNSKGGMDDDEFFEYLQKSIMKLYPDAS